MHWISIGRKTKPTLTKQLIWQFPKCNMQEKKNKKVEILKITLYDVRNAGSESA